MTKKYQMNLATKSMIKDQSLLRHEDIKQHIRILPELAAYIPPLSAEEYRQLQENILANGCREALLIWEITGGQLPALGTEDPAYILIDGHNRYAICQQYGLDYKIYLMSFPTIEQVKFFMIDNQLGRRNLAPEQVSYLRGVRYLNEKQPKGKYNRQEQKGQNDLYVSSEQTPATLDLIQPQVAKKETTAYRLGKQFNVSEKTIKRDAAFALGLERLSSTFREDILSGKQKVDKVLIQQLGRVEAEVALISSQAELEQTLQPSSPKLPVGTVKAESEKKVTAIGLKQQLAQLINQLDAPPVDLATLCAEIITCARQLQLQST